MREQKWQDSLLGATDVLPPALRMLARVMLNSRQPIFLIWGKERRVLYNDGYAPILGQRHPEAFGQPFNKVWPLLVDEVSPTIDRAYMGEAGSLGEITFTMRRTGYAGETHISFSCSPIQEETGKVIGLFCVCDTIATKDPTERHLKFRLDLDERLRHISDPLEVMAVAAEMLGRHLKASRVNYGYVEETPSGEFFTVDRDWTDGKTPSLVGRYRAEDFGTPLINVLKAGHTVCLHDAFDDQLTAGDGIAATYAAIGARSGITVPLIKDGKVAAALLVHQVMPRHWREDEETLVRQVAERTWEAVERARAGMALRESEERLRDILESINDAFYAIDRDWRFTYVNRKAEELWNCKRDELMRKVRWTELPQAVGTVPQAPHVLAMEKGIPIHLETQSPLSRRWLDVNIYPTGDGGLSVYFRDITDRKEAEEQREFLINELNHRVKNTLTTVQSIAAQTLRNDSSSGEVKAQLESRLFALSRAHDVLTRENWEGAALREIVTQALAPYREAEEERLTSAGPDIRLPPRVALALSLVLQELATNAVKHGALAQPKGRIEVVWSLDTSALPARLHLQWKETAGVPVKAPQRRGFGMRLIERSLSQELQGQVGMTFEPTGLVCSIELHLDVDNFLLWSDAGGVSGHTI